MRETMSNKSGETATNNVDWSRSKFRNGDISLDDAVKNIIKDEKNGKEFTLPNIDLLIGAMTDTPWKA